MAVMSELDVELEESLRPHLKAIAKVINAIADRTGISAHSILDYVNVEGEVADEIDNHTDGP